MRNTEIAGKTHCGPWADTDGGEKTKEEGAVFSAKHTCPHLSDAHKLAQSKCRAQCKGQGHKTPGRRYRDQYMQYQAMIFICMLSNKLIINITSKLKTCCVSKDTVKKVTNNHLIKVYYPKHKDQKPTLKTCIIQLKLGKGG